MHAKTARPVAARARAWRENLVAATLSALALAVLIAIVLATG